jgi:hypothetical protein
MPVAMSSSQYLVYRPSLTYQIAALSTGAYVNDI